MFERMMRFTVALFYLVLPKLLCTSHVTPYADEATLVELGERSLYGGLAEVASTGDVRYGCGFYLSSQKEEVHTDGGG